MKVTENFSITPEGSIRVIKVDDVSDVTIQDILTIDDGKSSIKCQVVDFGSLKLTIKILQIINSNGQILNGANIFSLFVKETTQAKPSIDLVGRAYFGGF